ncbi:MAG: glycosyltransferase family 39 protein [Gemmataceae bacterium]|nr:glycosyltransferase family 39 protein [Gemmataceae bacterium]
MRFLSANQEHRPPALPAADERWPATRLRTPGWRLPVLSWAILATLSGFLFWYGLNSGELLRTESLRAIIAQGMLDSGDWLVPRLYGEPLFTKPPGMYLAIVLCSLPFGQVTEWSARLPSALAASACVSLFAWYFGRRLGRSAGLAAGLILPMSLMWLDKATAAEIDMLQTAWITAAILFFFRAVESPCHPLAPSPCRTFPWWLAALLCMAGGVLTKWTAPQFFYGTAIPYLWWTGRLRLLFRWPHLVSAALAAGICVAWIAVVVSRESWDLFYRTVVWEGLSRLLPGYNTYRPYPWLESFCHPFKLLVTTLPWSGLALLALRPSFFRLWDRRGQDLLIALHCWVWPQMLFWSFPTEHTPRHSFPLFPGLAGLAAMVWLAWHDGRLPWRMPRWNPTKLLAGGLALWLTLKVVHVELVMPRRTLERQPRNKAAVLAALVPVSQVLYLFFLKDEGIMFYYGRPVVRLASPAELPTTNEPAYCILNHDEWQSWDDARCRELVLRMTDQQGDPIYLVRVF